MPESINDKAVFSLLEVTRSIQKTLTERYKSSFWVAAEMNKLNHYSHSGHCYPELVEKKDAKVVAQMKAILWKEDYWRVNALFQKVLKEPLRDGIKILFCAKIIFDPAYGLSLHILDIDPVYSLGELEKEKQESIDRLKKEGIFDQNKKLRFPLLPQRIAIISVETSKGYADFKSTLDGNQWGYRFFYLLFPALLQGEKAIPSIRSQLDRIKKVRHHFDVVVIIRGGGGDVGLSCYNNYLLSRDITNFPLPVLTGIGHATNETVAEMISFMNAITPTALAAYLLQAFHNFDVPVQQAKEMILEQARLILQDQSAQFNRTVKDLQQATRHAVSEGKFSLQHSITSIHQHSKFNCAKEKERLRLFPLTLKKSVLHLQKQQVETLIQNASDIKKASDMLLQNSNKDLSGLERIVISMSPQQVMKRGYTITRANGKSIKSIHEIKTGDRLETILSDGAIVSRVEEKQKTKNEQ